MRQCWRTEFQVLEPLPGWPRPRWVACEEADSPAYHPRCGSCRMGRHFLFQYSLAGRGWFARNGVRHDVPVGSGFLCPIRDDAVEYGYPPEATDPWRFAYMAFFAPPDMIDALLARAGSIFLLSPRESMLGHWLAYGKATESTVQLSVGEAAWLVHGLLGLFAGACSRDVETNPDAARLRALRQLVEADWTNNLTTTEAAGWLGITPEHLCRIVKRQTGRTPRSIIEEMRIRQAAEWLKNPSLPIKEVAARLGMANASHFARSFRRVTGLSPGAFRRRGLPPLP